MSTIRDFRDAPIGATAKLPGCPTVVKVTNLPTDKGNWSDGVVAWKAEYLVDCGYQLDKLPSRPTTAQEALDLAWDLAHPVKEGQPIPEGARLLDRLDRNDLSAYTTRVDFIITARESLHIRTLEPLPDPEPDWLDAPAVIAVCNDTMDRAVFVRENETGTQWLRDTRFYRWSDLRDVTPLWPKEDAAHSFHHDKPWCTRLGGDPA